MKIAYISWQFLFWHNISRNIQVKQWYFHHLLWALCPLRQIQADIIELDYGVKWQFVAHLACKEKLEGLEARSDLKYLSSLSHSHFLIAYKLIMLNLNPVVLNSKKKKSVGPSILRGNICTQFAMYKIFFSNHMP